MMTQTRMPTEWSEHRRCWMAWPSGGYVLGDDAAEAEETRRAWAAVANAVADFEEVVMVVDPEAVDIARSYLSETVVQVVERLDDAWMRDIGPTFVERADGRLGAITWRFNGWGAQSWARWDHDELIGGLVADRAGATITPSTIVNEGGAIHVDGKGTVLATLSVHLDPGRNPGATAADIEAELARTLGVTKTVWLPRGLYRDAKPPATRGHVDMMATFTETGRLLVHEQPDPAHPDHEIMEANIAILSEATDASGRPFEIVRIPAPGILVDETDDFVDYTYVNHLPVNGGVIVPAFGDAADERAAGIIAELYPGREVRMVPSRAIFRQGGGIHCITQQEPLLGGAR